MDSMTGNTLLAGLLFATAAVSGVAQAQSSSGGGASGDDGRRLHFGVFAEVRYDDNIGWAGNSASEVDDITTTVQGDLSYDLVKNASSELVLKGSVFYSDVADLSGLTHYGYIASLDFRSEFSPEFTAPWYGFHLGYTNIDFDDSEVREGYWYDLEATLGKRLSPAFGISGGLRYFDRSQTGDGMGMPFWQADEVFDQERWGAFGHADWFIGERTTVYLEYSYWDGDVNSTEFAPGEIFTWWEDFWSADPAFGPGWVVWKADAKQHIGELGIDFAMTDNLSIGGSAIYIQSRDTELISGNWPIDNYSNFAIMASINWSL